MKTRQNKIFLQNRNLRFFTIILLVVLPAFLCSCWQAVAVRAAKKRTQQTGYVVGTIEKETVIEDPLGRKQQSVDLSEYDSKPKEEPNK